MLMKILLLTILFSIMNLTASQFCNQNEATCPNMRASTCCKFPQFFSKQILRSCRARALSKMENGRQVFYEDSVNFQFQLIFHSTFHSIFLLSKCFLDCVFKAAGYPTNGNISGAFIKAALPPYSLDNPLAVINWYHFAETMFAFVCNRNWFTAGKTQKFSTIYRRALSAIEPSRPICNIRIAGFWDCIHNMLMGQCVNEMLTQTPHCQTMRMRAVNCFWW
uniref:CSON004891 protein n=1 Tax=Culicoides sonorensis TaxID=179676 RepID=A0A336MQL2_CULSO